MNDKNRRFWPFRPRTSIASSIIIFVSLIIIFLVMKQANIKQKIEYKGLNLKLPKIILNW